LWRLVVWALLEIFPDLLPLNFVEACCLALLEIFPDLLPLNFVKVGCTVQLAFQAVSEMVRNRAHKIREPEIYSTVL
jgi:hypothetical protein